MSMHPFFRKSVLAACIAGACGSLLTPQARTIVVNNQAANAADANAGTEPAPLKTIQAGANLAQPGDTVLVKTGIYREWVKPPRGGISEQQRIVYRAGFDQKVSIRGSERITTWVDQGGNVWMVELSNTFFGSFNPFTSNLSGGWLNYGSECHRGEVYLNEAALYEKQSLSSVQSTAMSWFAQQSNGMTRIYANFGGANPNSSLSEINVRVGVVFPALEGLGYITVEGFNIRHAADYWCYHGQQGGQGGAVGPNWGLRWIIQNCTISDAKCIGVGIGSAPNHCNYNYFNPGGLGLPSGTTFGHHIIRNNHITRCGQSGIYGSAGPFASIIEGNFIDKISYKKEFGGWENASIKLHYGNDVRIKDNRIEPTNMNNSNAGCPAIFLDWGAQNCRISGNVIYGGEGLKLEINHGPILVDNNVFFGTSISNWGEAGVFVHNIFYNSSLGWTDERNSPWKRVSNVFMPHSTADNGKPAVGLQDDRVLNNIFIQRSPRSIPGGAANFLINNNLYLDGASKVTGSDAASTVDATPTNWTLVQDSSQINLALSFSSAAIAVICPQVKAATIGKFAVPNMYIEEQDGTPVNIAADYFGKSMDLAHILPGPLQSIKQGTNSIKLWPKTLEPTIVTAPGAKRVASYTPVKPASVAVYDVLGHLVAKSSRTSLKMDASAGVYIINSGDGARNVVRR